MVSKLGVIRSYTNKISFILFQPDFCFYYFNDFFFMQQGFCFGFVEFEQLSSVHGALEVTKITVHLYLLNAISLICSSSIISFSLVVDGAYSLLDLVTHLFYLDYIIDHFMIIFI